MREHGLRPTTRLTITMVVVVFLVTIAVVWARGAGESEQGSQPNETVTEADDLPPQPESAASSRFVGRVAAPAFSPGVEWINVSQPLTWQDLRGKVVVLDFWTYGCINCIHMIPILDQLQEKYRDELVVVGVHSAKFSGEGETQNIRQVAQRYRRTGPLVNDSDFLVWRSWGVRAWPTIAIVDPAGNAVAVDSGEIPFSVLDEFVGGVVRLFDERGELSREPLAAVTSSSSDSAAAPLLSFPGKVLADPRSNRLFIADSGHHRIVEVEITSGEIVGVYGDGERGSRDGAAARARFDTPQGMALDGDILYVADLGNHAIREIDLSRGTVRTVVGSGDFGTGFHAPGSIATPPLQLDLRSPWDVEIGPTGLYIAMAGSHQIWRYSIDRRAVEVVVGTGREGLVNRTPESSELAQPSGLFLADGRLFFADSESSSVRVADFGNGRVTTVAGPQDNTLFDFGDLDGAPGVSRLQHPLGVTGDGAGRLYIADTYNNRIKVVDLTTDETTTLFGRGGTGGFRDGDRDNAEFDEPGGLDYAAGTLYVADTNNHAIRVIDLARGEVRTLRFTNPERLATAGRTLFQSTPSDGRAIVTLSSQTVSSETERVRLVLELPDGYKINSLAESTYTVRPLETAATDQGGAAGAPEVRGAIRSPETEIPIAGVTPDTRYLEVEVVLYYCEEEKEELCLLDLTTLRVPLEWESRAPRRIDLRYAVEIPEEGPFPFNM